MLTKLFRNTLIASTLMVAGSVLANPAMAAPEVINLGGSVTDVSSVTPTATPAAAALVLGGTGSAQTDVFIKVADLALFTNQASGVTLTATGGSGAQLINSSNNATPVDYVVLITADQATEVNAASFGGATGTDSDAVTDFDSSGNSARDLYIMYSTDALLDPGTYSGSITVTVAPL